MKYFRKQILNEMISDETAIAPCLEKQVQGNSICNMLTKALRWETYSVLPQRAELGLEGKMLRRLGAQDEAVSRPGGSSLHLQCPSLRTHGVLQLKHVFQTLQCR